MSAPLFSASQMDAIRKIANQGMQATIQLERLQNVETPTGSQSTWISNGTADGWIFSRPTPMMTIVSGAQVLVNTYRLYVKVGTDIRTGDRVITGGETYTVSDTTGESTWLPLMSVSLRKEE